MTPDRARAMYRRQIDRHGETVTLRRDATEATVKARVRGATTEELIAGMDQRQRVVILLADDLATEGWPDRPRQNDELVMRGRTAIVEESDDDTRRVAGVLIAYEITVLGG